jgi:hypothetical protein
MERTALFYELTETVDNYTKPTQKRAYIATYGIAVRCEVCQAGINLYEEEKYNNYDLCPIKNGIIWMRMWAHVACIEDRLSRWARFTRRAGGNSDVQHAGKSYINWIMAKSKYLYHVAGYAIMPQAWSSCDMALRDREAVRLTKVEFSTHGLLCLWELGLHSDLACPIIVFAYWIL